MRALHLSAVVGAMALAGAFTAQHPEPRYAPTEQKKSRRALAAEAAERKRLKRAAALMVANSQPVDPKYLHSAARRRLLAQGASVIAIEGCAVECADASGQALTPEDIEACIAGERLGNE